MPAAPLFRTTLTLLALLIPARAQQSGFTCDTSHYLPSPGLQLAVNITKPPGTVAQIIWTGERNEQLRASFAVRATDGQPLVGQLAARKSSTSAWIVLGENLSPEYAVTSGRRRMSSQQWDPLKALGVAITPAVIEKEKWNAFWDAPLNIPGAAGTSNDLPRQASEIRRANASFAAKSCTIQSDGSRVEVRFPNAVTMGIFSGDLQYTIYAGANLLRQEVIAATNEESVAYKYDGGLRNFSLTDTTRISWRDEARAWQEYRFGGGANNDRVPLRARNRVAFLETNSNGTLAVFPPPHKFFFSREIETNLGYVYYRKDDAKSLAIGVRQAEQEQPYKPYGLSEAIWNRREKEARHHIDNFALYNAPPGTRQRMPVYFYLSPGDDRTTQQHVLAFTHDDVYKAVPGFKTLTSHFHMHFNEQLSDAGTMDLLPSWRQVFRSLGINVVILADFHGDAHPNDAGPLRFAEQKVYFDGCRRNSDRDFLLIPGEEPDATLGGHYMMAMPRPVYWSHVRKPGQEYTQAEPQYGKVYHIANATDELNMLKAENGFMWQAHPRTKGSTGYPDAVRDKAHFLSDRFLGGSYQSLPVDQSQSRLCEVRCLDLLNDMNNWSTSPKYMIAEGDTYMKYPDDETYPQLIVNYVKLDKVPLFDEDWSPVLQSMRAGNYFVSSGEVLFRNWSIQGTGPMRNYMAEIEWTFPLEFIELVSSDGQNVSSQVIRATDRRPFGSEKLQIAFDPKGKKWVRLAVWDSAGNGAFTQPIHLTK